ncbi:hypothetical protein MTO96_037304 [Rhipicephalus appendiculatus]
MAKHCLYCGCQPDFHNSLLLDKAADKKVREIVEAIRIMQEGSRCISRRSTTPAEYPDDSKTSLRHEFDSQSESEAESDDELVAESVSEPVLGPAREPVLEPFCEPVLERGPVGESARDPIPQSSREPVTESAREPVLECVRNPVAHTHSEMSLRPGVDGQYILTDLVSSAADELLNSAIRILNAIKGQGSPHRSPSSTTRSPSTREGTSGGYGTLARHCLDCGCEPDFHRCRLISKEADKKARDFAEALEIKKAGTRCVTRQFSVVSKIKTEVLTDSDSESGSSAPTPEPAAESISEPISKPVAEVYQ